MRFTERVGGAATNRSRGRQESRSLYVEETFGHDLAHLAAPRLYRIAEYMLVDETTRRHLELIASTDGTRKGSLLSILDETLTAVGARTLSQLDRSIRCSTLEAIRARHDAVEELFDADLGGDAGGVVEANRRSGAAGGTNRQRCARRRAIACGWAMRCRRCGIAQALRWVRCKSSAGARASGANFSRCPRWSAQIAATLSPTSRR